MQITVDGCLYIDGQEVAQRAGVTTTCVWNWSRRGTLPSYRWGLSTRLWFKDEDVRSLLVMRRVDVPKPQRRSRREAAIADEWDRLQIDRFCNSGRAIRK